MTKDPLQEQPQAPPELELHPQPRVKRLNRLAVLLVAIAAILVLWTAYFVLSTRTPTATQEARPARTVIEQNQLALERLRQRALEQQEPPEPFLLPKPPPQPQPRPFEPPPFEPQSRPARPETSREDLRLQRAQDADVLVPAFERSREPAPGGSSSLPLPASVTAPGPESRDGLRASHPSGPALPEDPNLLQRKDDFLRQAQQSRTSFHLPATVQEPLSPFEIQEGSLLPAILVAGINSDLPGQTRALVRRDVYDTTTGRYLLVPQGSRLIGEYDNRVAWGQKRVLLAWTRLIFPDGRSLDLRGMPGADLAAMAGVRDQVNNHFVRTFGSAILLSAITAGVQLSQPQESVDFGSAPSARQIAAAALGQEVGRATAEITRRNVNIQPTLQIRPGYLFNIEVTADMILPGPYPAGLPATE